MVFEMKNLWLKIKTNWKKTVLTILGIGIAYAAVELLPEVTPDANPVIRELKHFNFNGEETRNGGRGSFVGGYANYMKNGAWAAVDYTFATTTEGFCMDKAPFKACVPLRSIGATIFLNNNEF